MDDFCAPDSSYELGVQNGYERAGCLTLKLAKDMPVVGCEIVTCATQVLCDPQARMEAANTTRSSLNAIVK